MIEDGERLPLGLEAGNDLSELDYMDLVKVEPLDVDDEDQLESQLSAFVATVRQGGRPVVDAHAGFAAVRTAERIVESARAHTEQLQLSR